MEKEEFDQSMHDIIKRNKLTVEEAVQLLQKLIEDLEKAKKAHLDRLGSKVGAEEVLFR